MELKVKPNCDCGKPSITKGLCNICYQRNYQRKIYGWKSGQPRKKRESKHKINEVFNMVLSEVKKGITIQTSCAKCKISRSSFYRLLSENQKKELFAAKLISKLKTTL